MPSLLTMNLYFSPLAFTPREKPKLNPCFRQSFRRPLEASRSAFTHAEMENAFANAIFPVKTALFSRPVEAQRRVDVPMAPRWYLIHRRIVAVPGSIVGYGSSVLIKVQHPSRPGKSAADLRRC